MVNFFDELFNLWNVHFTPGKKEDREHRTSGQTGGKNFPDQQKDFRVMEEIKEKERYCDQLTKQERKTENGIDGSLYLPVGICTLH